MEAGDERSSEGTDATAGGPPSGPSRRGRGLLIGGVISLGLLFLTVGTVVLVLVVGPDGLGGGSAAAPERFKEKYVSGEGSERSRSCQ